MEMEEEGRYDELSGNIFVGAGWALLLSIPVWGGLILLAFVLRGIWS